MEKSLDEQIKDIETKMPGVKKLLEKFGDTFELLCWTKEPENVTYLETDKYKITAAKWKGKNWYVDGGRTEEVGWVSIYYLPKNTNEIKEIKSRKIVILHGCNLGLDRKELLLYNKVSLETINPNEVEVAWADKEGNKGPMYKVK